MFEQVVGSGANLFFIIVAILIGFLNGLAFVDYKKVKKEEQERNHH